MRRTLSLLVTGLLAGLGCGLLAPYPGGGDAAESLGGARTDGGEAPIVGGVPQEPLVDPAVDDSIAVVSNADTIIALPGESFVIDLEYVAEQGNVVGGGIQFSGSDRVQWTLIEGLEGSLSGNVQFAYAVPSDICDEVPNLCHAIETQQFAVARNVSPGGDVDDDGEADGDFVISPPANVTVVLKCATCESTSCMETLPAGSCLSCAQPDACAEAFELCFAPGRPKAETDEGVQFGLFFGRDGLAWKAPQSCAAGEELCDDALEKARLECMGEGGTDDAGEETD